MLKQCLISCEGAERFWRVNAVQNMFYTQIFISINSPDQKAPVCICIIAAQFYKNVMEGESQK